MTDNIELLKLAAKAEGRYVPKKNTPWEGIDECGIYVDKTEDARRPVYWNPLTDDGDAFRLGFAIGAVIYMEIPKTLAEARLEVVKTAAAIGKSMK